VSAENAVRLEMDLIVGLIYFAIAVAAGTGAVLTGRVIGQ
jgi:hypothetical protein